MEADLEDARERAWRHIAAIDAAYERGEIDQDGWHAGALAIVESAYTAAHTAEAGSGHSGTPEDWEATRGPVMAAIERDGSFLDVGCANGLLMDSVHRWGATKGIRIEPYGVEISPRIADLARRRYPHWADRISVANAASWRPPMRFDYVRTALEYVPADRAEAYVADLLANVVAPGGRLIVGKTNERRVDTSIGQRLQGWGHELAGELRLPHAHPDLLYSWFWVDHRDA